MGSDLPSFNLPKQILLLETHIFRLQKNPTSLILQGNEEIHTQHTGVFFRDRDGSCRRHNLRNHYIF